MLFAPIRLCLFFFSFSSLRRFLYLSLIYELLNWSKEFCTQIHRLIDITMNWQCLGLFLATIVWVISKCFSNDTWNLCLVDSLHSQLPRIHKNFETMKIGCVFNFMLHALAIIIIVLSRWICLNRSTKDAGHLEHYERSYACSAYAFDELLPLSMTFSLRKLVTADVNWWVTFGMFQQHHHSSTSIRVEWHTLESTSLNETIENSLIFIKPLQRMAQNIGDASYSHRSELTCLFFENQFTLLSGFACDDIENNTLSIFSFAVSDIKTK